MDAITLAAVRRELDETLTNGRVQAVVQPDEQGWSRAGGRDYGPLEQSGAE